MTEDKQTTPEEIQDEALEEAQGGVGMLLPAVQSAREAAKKKRGSGTPLILQALDKNEHT